jgi:hypothetical protein
MSMMDAFESGEYDSESLEPAENGFGMLTYEPFSHPFGGTAA